MTKLPKISADKFLVGEKAMGHLNRLWNSIWSNQIIELTVRRYGHGPARMVGITFNDKALDQWSRSSLISSLVEHNLLELSDIKKNKDVTQHKEESKSWIKLDTLDRENV